MVVFGSSLVVFRSDNLSYAYKYLANMFGFLNLNSADFIYKMPYYFGRIEIIVFFIAILCCMPIFKNITQSNNKIIKPLVNIWLLLLFFLSTISIASNTYNPFIYFRF